MSPSGCNDSWVGPYKTYGDLLALQSYEGGS